MITMGILGTGFDDIVTMIKDMTLFFVAWTLVSFVAGQWYAEAVPYRSNVWWYPTYLLIIVLVIKVIADALTSGGKKDKKK
ncbi:hypothetical protein H0N95_02120 [Candidatus Micrarchaeota archaeon]|nr:hypothetical protein [Candidatus Micrarchaeota archaeon]